MRTTLPIVLLLAPLASLAGCGAPTTATIGEPVEPVADDTLTFSTTAGPDTVDLTGTGTTDPDTDPDTHTGAIPDGLCQLAVTCPRAIPDSPALGCTLRVTDAEGGVYWDGPAGMQLRGRSSAAFPKPQIAAELWDDRQQPVGANLLGMGADSDWVLNGAYIDRALLRNQLAYDLFQALGGPERYAPESHTCWMTLNGEDFGVYFLVEKIKQDDDRIDIADDPDGGAFVVKLDDEGGILDNSPVGYGYWEAVSPPAPTGAQTAGIRAALQDWQDALRGSGRDADAALLETVDLDSVVDFVLVEELLRNNDAYFLSIYLWKDVDTALRFAPWDLDLTLGQPTYNDNTNPEGWVQYRPTMIARLGDLPEFRDRLAARWRELRADAWSDEALIARIDAQYTLLGPQLAANFEVWRWEDIPAYWSTLPSVAGPEEEYARIRDWLPTRTAWIDRNIESY